jgi:hypothetical protein
MQLGSRKCKYSNWFKRRIILQCAFWNYRC